MNNYEDIINLPHYVSKNHPQMSRMNRAAQFAPFAALTGYEKKLDEAARITDNKIEIDEQRKQELDEAILWLLENIAEHPEVKITFFMADEFKEGGSYLQKSGSVKKIDIYSKKIIFMDNTIINIDDLYDIEYTR